MYMKARTVKMSSQTKGWKKFQETGETSSTEYKYLREESASFKGEDEVPTTEWFECLLFGY